MTQQFIKPAHENLVVRHPNTFKRLSVDGEAVTWTAYWQKRWDERSVVTAEPVPNNPQEPLQASLTPDEPNETEVTE